MLNKTTQQRKQRKFCRRRRRMTLRRGGNLNYDQQILSILRYQINVMPNFTITQKDVLNANLETLPYDPDYIFLRPRESDATFAQAFDRIDLATYGIVWFTDPQFPMNYPPKSMEMLVQFLLNEKSYLLDQTQTARVERMLDLVNQLLANLNELPYEPNYRFFLANFPEINSDEERDETSPTRGYYQGIYRLLSVLQNRVQPWFEEDTEEHLKRADLIYENVVSEVIAKIPYDENLHPENINSFNVISGENEPFNEALRGEDGNGENVIFSLDRVNYFTVSRQQMKNSLTENPNFIRFECEGENNRKRKNNIPYALTNGVIIIPAGVVPVEQLKYVIENKHIALVYLESANRTIEFMGSPENFGLFMQVSGHHCQQGTIQTVYNLKEVEIIKITDGRRRNRIRKTLRKQRPRRPLSRKGATKKTRNVE